MDRKRNLSGGRLRSIILVGVITAALVVYVLYLKQRDSETPSSRPLVVVGRPAPDFALPGLDGRTVRLSDYRGKVVFLNIWATWCGPCREEMPSMEKLYRQMQGQAFEILAVSIDILGAKAVAPFMAELKLNFPALLDPQGDVGTLYSTTGVPETFIVDPDGIITAKIIGARNWATPEAVQVFKELVGKPAGEIRGGGSSIPAKPQSSGDRP
jgi:peroxiredoxin